MDTEAAFKDAFKKHSDELFLHASMRINDRERAVELTQESFMRAWEFLSRGGIIEKYRPFLYRVLNNLIIDEYRKHKTQSLDALLENEETAAAIEGDLLRDSTDIFEEAAVQFDFEQALAVIEHLPLNYRIVLIMRYVDGLSPQEIAECLNETENAVSVRLHRSIRKVRDLISSQHITP